MAGRTSTNRSLLTRRQALKSTALASIAAGAVSTIVPSASAAADDSNWKITNGRIRQSVMGWCFNPMPTLELAGHCKALGMAGMEGVSSKHYPAIKKLGLEISLVGSHGFKEGPCNPNFAQQCRTKLLASIDLAVKVGCPSVITFTGMKFKGTTDAKMSQNCVELWKSVMDYAEKQKINLCLEHLNSRDDSHPMKGHPGYFGDDVDHCMDLIKSVGSPRMKLLFDVYHVQIMNGDVIRRINQFKDYIGHYHTAGNPGRGELDEHQEINYPAVMHAILKTGYRGFVAQEFIPTWKDKVKSLRHGVRVCDV